MVHVTCDLCGKQLMPGQAHHVVKIEVFAAHDPGQITEDDLDTDHVEAVGQLLEELEEADDPEEVDPANLHLRFDLCPECRKRFARDPLSKDSSQKLFFSEN